MRPDTIKFLEQIIRKNTLDTVFSNYFLDTTSKIQAAKEQTNTWDYLK